MIRNYVILGVKYVFFTLVAIGLLMDSLQFVGALILLTVLVQSIITCIVMNKEVIKHD